MITPVRVRHPFPGLRPFDDTEDYLFFGREEQIDEILGRLRNGRRFLSIVGTSGSGKSSLIRAGIFPRLRAGGMSGAGSRWRIVMFRPGNEPIKTLAIELGHTGLLGPAEDEDTALRVDFAQTSLELGGLSLVEVFKQGTLAEEENLLVVIDQFEELFRYAQEDTGASAAFVDLLLEASTFENLRLYVILVMRSDFLGHCAQFEGLPERVNEGIFLTPRLDRSQLERAISNPVRVAGETIDQPLVNELLNEVGRDLNQLPVLQHALMRTWEFWQKDHKPGEKVGLRYFEATGGLGSAIDKHADQIYLGEDFSISARDAARRLFSAITERGVENLYIRRPIKFKEVRAITGADEADLRFVLDKFRERSCSFLLPSPEVNISDSSVIDISHESLMTLWKRLKGWVEEESQSARMYRRLTDDAALYPGTSLWVDPTLALAEEWYDKREPNAAWAEHTDKSYREGEFKRAIDFLQAGIKKREDDRKAALAQKEAAAAAERDRLKREARAEQERVRLETQAEQERVRRETQAEQERVRLEAHAEQERVKREAHAEQERVKREAKARLDNYKNVAIGVLGLCMLIMCGLIVRLIIVENEINRNAFASKLVAAADAKYRRDGSRRDLAMASSAAYALNGNKEARDLLLESVSGLPGMGRVEIPDWTLASVSDGGRLISVILDHQSGQNVLLHSDLLVLNSKLEELSFTPNLRADLMCGFRSAKKIAVVNTESKELTFYDAGAVGGARPASSLNLKSVAAWRGATGDATALACAADDTRVAVAVDGRVVVSDGKRVPYQIGGLTRHGRITALNWSPSGVFVSATWIDTKSGGSPQAVVDLKSKTHLSVFDVKGHHQIGPSIDLIDPGLGCHLVSCSLVAFSPDGRHISWYDDSYVHTNLIRNLNAGSRQHFDIKPIANVSIFYASGGQTPDLQTPGVFELAQIPNRKPRVIEAQIFENRAGRYEAIREFPVGRFDQMPVYDPDRAVALANDRGKFGRDFGNGIAVHSVLPGREGDGDSAAILAAQLNWSESYVMIGDGKLDNDGVAIADQSGPLDISLKERTAAFSISPALRLRDSGDGIHAVSYDSKRRVFAIWDMGVKPAQVLRRVSLANSVVPRLKSVLHFAYDPTTAMLTVLSDTGWQRYDSNANLWDGFISLDNIKKALRPAHVTQSSEMWLSRRGRFLVAKGKDNLSTILDPRGQVKRAGFVFLGSSPDDKILLGQAIKHDQIGPITAFQIEPQFAEVGSVAGSLEANFVELSRDQREIAVVDQVSGDIQMVERGTGPGQGDTLHLGGRVPNFSISRVAFSVSGKYLVAQYQETSPGRSPPRQFLRVFSVDPEDWRRSACLMSGMPMTSEESFVLTGSHDFFDSGCNEYRDTIMFHR